MPLDRPIPAFYCCYLLRSTVRHSGVYIGSTPNPARRLRQHNGDAKGGAARTNRDSLRPWEMTCIVTGFPSHIAALQFEWAWQNPHVTLHIPPASRIQHATQKKRSGQAKRPRHSIASLLSNLHLLLRVPSFSRWPLEVRFFCADVHKTWLKWSSLASEPIRDSMAIIQDFPTQDSAPSIGQTGSPSRKKKKFNHGIAKLKVDYSNLKPYVEKAKGVVDLEREGTCAVCFEGLEHDAGIYAICPNQECETVTHMKCLSKHFLKDEGDILIPVKGTCPMCKAELQWVDIVSELSLRLRGQNEVEKLLKGERARVQALASSQAMLESSNIEDDPDEIAVERGFEEEIKMIQELNPHTHGFDMGDSWHAIDDSDESDTRSIGSNTSQARRAKPYKASSRTAGLGAVVEDSDWDDAEVLD